MFGPVEPTESTEPGAQVALHGPDARRARLDDGGPHALKTTAEGT
jgi:hypothetical protein